MVSLFVAVSSFLCVALLVLQPTAALSEPWTDKFSLGKYFAGEWSVTRVSLSPSTSATSTDTVEGDARIGLLRLSLDSSNKFVEGLYYENTTAGSFTNAQRWRIDVPTQVPKDGGSLEGSFSRLLFGGDYASLEANVAASQMFPEEDGDSSYMPWFDYEFTPVGSSLIATAKLNIAKDAQAQRVVVRLVSQEVFVIDTISVNNNNVAIVDSTVFSRNGASQSKPWWTSMPMIVGLFALLTISRALGAKSKAQQRREQVMRARQAQQQATPATAQERKSALEKLQKATGGAVVVSDAAGTGLSSASSAAAPSSSSSSQPRSKKQQ